MTAKRRQPEHVARWKREHELRNREKGGRLVGVRLGPATYSLLRELCDLHACTTRDVVEGLLLGTITLPPAGPGVRRPNYLGLSPDEIAAARSLGIEPPTARRQGDLK